MHLALVFLVLFGASVYQVHLRTRKAHRYVATLGSFAWCYPHPEVNLKAMRKYGLDMNVSARKYT